MLLNVSQQTPLLGSPLRRHTIKEARVYPTVKFIHIHGINPILKTGVLAAKPANGFVAVAVAVGLRDWNDVFPNATCIATLL
ncbi:MAG: hypothetical protein WAU45_18025 [Blastocatellia bacterium]